MCPASTPWRADDFFVLRTPYLPVETLHSLGEGLEAASCTDPCLLEAALERDRGRVRERLRTWCERPEVREALAVASPSLMAGVSRWRRSPDGRRGRKVERSLLRYAARMSGRPTPFGLFAGVSVGSTGAVRTALRLAPAEQYRRRTRLDCRYLAALCDALHGDPDIKRCLAFAPNSSLYRAGGGFRYAASHASDEGTVYTLVAVACLDPLEAVLERAGAGARQAELVEAVRAAEPAVSREEAQEFVEELIHHDILVSRLQPTVSGPEPLHGVVDALDGIPGCPPAHRVATRLKRVRDELAVLDSAPPGTHPTAYDRLGTSVAAALPAPCERAGLFHVDLIKPAVTADLGSEVIDEITEGLSLLQRVGGTRTSDPLAEFREAFRRRYGHRSVPLCEVLDEDTGIGFPVAHHGDPSGAAERAGEPPPPRREALLLRWLAEAYRDGSQVIFLGEREVESLAAAGAPAVLPEAFSVRAVVLAGSRQALEQGRFRVLLSGVGGPSGANSFGRFCHAEDRLRERVRAHLRAEEGLRPDAVFAEVVHLPTGRAGNVLARPRLRDHEIPYLGRSVVSPERQIPVTDLLVSIVQDRVVLWSARLDREVVPRITTAHDFRGAGNLALYRFLGRLQGQDGTGSLFFSFGDLSGAPFLPRVTAGRLVLSRARWNLSADQLSPFRKLQGAALFTAVQSLRRRVRLPRWVALAEGDQLLPLDLDNVLCVETLAHMVGNCSRASLVEVFLEPDQVLVTGPEGRFLHEIVLPFSQVKSTRPRPTPFHPPACGRPVPVRAFRRTFGPSSEWLYAKLYTGTARADAVLRHIVPPLVTRFLESGAIDEWFFVRYSDPDWHIRLRMHGEPARLLNEVLPTLHDAVAGTEGRALVRSLQLDTYEREIERYGGAIRTAERIFHADSDAALDIVASVPADDRWRVALVGYDRLLTDFGFATADKHAVVAAARGWLSAQLGLDGRARSRIGARYRAERADLRALLESAHSSTLGESALRARSHVVRPLAERLRAEAGAGRLTRPLPVLASTFLHMHANRLLRSHARPQELLICDFLCRLYEASAHLSHD
ncbi:lantibiotic dehydratase [Streptomyces cinerochromogenes]|uniref:lantibiotic dehydratase n=1 Tax=Streptomyces cinerochromogenes TaxID=66422 RepID=UPI0016709F2A|nr:lantibiotic dehydratase [Streptomyces cinerochromogenes]